MKTIIAGCRDYNDYNQLRIAVTESGIPLTTILSGKARGVDYLGELYAHQYQIPVDPYPADWDEYGQIAGRIRNRQMADNADALIALWDFESRGTKHMIETATEMGLIVYVHDISSL